MKKVDWSKLPEELLGVIALRLFSVIELLRFRSVCKSWRSSVPGDDNTLSPRPLIEVNPLVVTISTAFDRNGLKFCAFLSRASFFRVTLSSSSSSSSLSRGKGWLIKADEVRFQELHLVNPLSRDPLLLFGQQIDLSEFSVTEIREAYAVRIIRRRIIALGLKRVVLVRDHTVLGVGCDGKIRYWNGEIWARLKDQMAQFSDIIVHRGLTYAVDSRGIVWWINSSLSIYRYGPSLDENMIANCCSEKSLVECCGELYIVDRLLADENLRKKKNDAYEASVIANGGHPPRLIANIQDDAGNETCKLSHNLYPKTLGFKIYKMDEELGKWVEVKSLRDKAFLMATDCCFSISAHDYYGCLENAIYFTDEDYEMKVFKLDDGSITTTTKTMGGMKQSCFQLFDPTFPSN